MGNLVICTMLQTYFIAKKQHLESFHLTFTNIYGQWHYLNLVLYLFIVESKQA